ncbi:ATP F0F1 synthase subunit C [Fodinicola acaciae]|uniref:ATP F0F1 synthase subunit C n=1 Tax=Fodinicola acaciae TaxID=2681555 RepID=UPI0013D40E65|nr:ATP F0F1 synthase subunit C [Fodinicola acaciae]
MASDQVLMGALIAGGIALGGGAIGAAIGDGLVGSAMVNSLARQPESRGRTFPVFALTLGVVEAAYFINLAFMVVFVFTIGKPFG